MIDTKLILIEGIPGSGKSTIATRLSDLIIKIGIPCECYLEWSKNNPINIGEMEDLTEIISSSMSRGADVLKQWEYFSRTAKYHPTVTIVESRFWQTDAMYLLLSGHTETDIMARVQRIEPAITELNPVLIYLTPQDIEQHLLITVERKNKKWRELGKDGSWEMWGNQIYEQQKWFTNHSLMRSEAFVLFFTEWTSIADRLFEILQFRKIKIQFNHSNWDVVNMTIQQFLKIP